MPEKPVAFRDIPADRFPFTMEVLTKDGTVVWSVTIDGPGAVEIPGLAAFYGPVSSRITFPNGEVHEHGPEITES